MTHATPVDPVDAILARHSIQGPWEPLQATGIANRIYATRDVVLRVATDHPEGTPDARTESVAAPVARRAGIQVPELLAFDDSRELVDRPYTIWERVHAETLGLFAPDPLLVPDTWRAVGRELAELHLRVQECPDPNGWLDEPGRSADLAAPLAHLASTSLLEPATVKQLERWIEVLRPAVAAPAARCFLHDDIHEMNLMCDADGALRAVIDWGDAGWGDPVLELAGIPLAAQTLFLEGYQAVAPHLLGELPAARMLWDRIDRAFWDLDDDPPDRGPLDALLQIAEEGETPWGDLLR